MIRTQSRKITSSIKTAFMLSITISLISAGIFIGSDALFASAKKPATVIEWSNGFPSGEHANLNIHGKKLDPFFNCDNSDAAKPFGGSIFVKMRATEEYPGPSKIEFVSNKRASIDILQVLDPCAAPFGQEHHHLTDSALVQLEAKEMQVYWRILGKPNNGNNSPSVAMLSFPTLIGACNFLPTEFADGSIVDSFHPDAQLALGLEPFVALEKHTGALFTNAESIYFDTDNSGDVDNAVDVRLYGPIVDDGTVLNPFNPITEPLVKHEDTGATLGFFDLGETIYLDADDSGTVTFDDIRIANASSQGLPEDEGGDAINCDDDTLVGLGLINNKGVFLKDGETLKRFEDPEPVKGKGKSKAVNITDLFIWSGVLCDPESAADVDGNGEISLDDDFPALVEADIMAAAIAAGVYTPDGLIDNAEFIAYLAATYADCFAFYEEWIFIIADIVRYGIDYVNDGATLTQIRFYPVETLFD